MFTYLVNGPLSSEELNSLFSAGGPGQGWPRWQRSPDSSDWQSVLEHNLVQVTSRSAGQLVGFINVAWDGRDHAFLLDTRVHPSHRHQGVGKELVRMAANAAAQAGCETLHVDYDASLGPFYIACGFEPTEAGLVHLK